MKNEKIDWPLLLLISFFSLLAIATVTGQGTVRPDQFPLEANPNNSNFEVYSQKGGVNKRASLLSIRNYVLQGLTSVAGPAGPAGPANSLSIGTVTSGPTPGATITGAAPAQTLNLVLPEAGAAAGLNLSNGGKSGYNQTVNISGGGTGVTFDVRDADADSINEIQVFTLDSIGAWALTKSGGTGNIKDGVTYSNDSLKLWGYVADLKPHINKTYFSTTIANRDTITNVPDGSTVIISDANGEGVQGISWANPELYIPSAPLAGIWSEPVLINKPTSYQYTVTHGGTTAVIWATGTGVTITTNETTGECNIAIPTKVHLHKVHITLPFGAVDGSNNYYVKLDYQGLRTYNTSISNVNLPAVTVGSAVITSMSRSSPVLFGPDGYAGVDVGISLIAGGDGSDLEIAIKDFLIATTQNVTLNFSTH